MFVFGTLKQGFPNSCSNHAQRIDDDCQTLQPYPLYLVGERHSPWLIDQPGEGLRVTGELYRVDADKLQLMDRLERIDQADGYRRKSIAVKTANNQELTAFCYLKPSSQLAESDIKLGPLANYDLQHAKLYRSRLPGS